MRLGCITVITLVVACTTNGQLKPSANGWYPLGPESYPEVLDALKRAFDNPVKHRTFNRVTPLKINIAAIKLGVQPRMFGASFEVDFDHSAENPSCDNFIAAIQLGKNPSDKPTIENWSCYYKDKRALRFNKMVRNLDMMVPGR